jgi:hypothetical protein
VIIERLWPLVVETADQNDAAHRRSGDAALRGINDGQARPDFVGAVVQSTRPRQRRVVGRLAEDVSAQGDDGVGPDDQSLLAQVQRRPRFPLGQTDDGLRRLP